MLNEFPHEAFELDEYERDTWAYMQLVLCEGGRCTGDGVSCGEFKANKEFEPCNA